MQDEGHLEAYGLCAGTKGIGALGRIRRKKWPWRQVSFSIFWVPHNVQPYRIRGWCRRLMAGFCISS